MPGFNPELFAAMADMIYKKGGFDINQLKSKEARSVMAETARIINSGVSSSLPEDCPDALRYALENNAFIFSGFKTFHSMREIGLSMVTDRGTVKQYEDFKKDVQRINAHYNTNYLHAEYYHAVGSAQMAARWNEYAKDGDRYDLQYRTAGDSRVREEHRLLDGITLPVDDPFWDKYFPPNGWGCRCEAVQVRKGKYTLSDSADSMRKGDNITAGVKQQMFRFNPGKTMKLFPPKHPYYPKGCEGCTKRINLAYEPDSERCQSCNCITRYALNQIKNSAVKDMKSKNIAPYRKNDDRFVTGKMYCGNSDRKNLIQHIEDISMLSVALDIDNILETISEGQYEDIVPSHMTPAKARRCVIKYSKYQFQRTLHINGEEVVKTIQLKCEVRQPRGSIAKEYPYSVRIVE